MTKKMEALMGWIAELCWPKEPERFVEILTEEGESNPEEGRYEHRFKFRLYTHRNCYQFVAIDRSEESGYLGCQSSKRKMLPGEDWVRGSDLPDGQFTRKTWNRILRGIAHNEIITLSEFILSGGHEEMKKNGMIPAGAWINDDSPIFTGEGIEEIPDDEDLGLGEGSPYLGDLTDQKIIDILEED